MAKLITPTLVRRGLVVFGVLSLLGLVATLFYGRNTSEILPALARLHWGWVLAGVGLAAMDWLGGGLRLWVIAREIHPKPPLGGMILAGGMSAWAAYLTPLQSGAGPMMMYVMRRYGVPLPVAVTSTLLTFVATVIFFALAGPIAILAGAGRALEAKGAVLGLSLYDLFLGSLGIFGGLAVLLGLVMVAPRLVRDWVHRFAGWIGRRNPALGERVERLQGGIDDIHRSILAFSTWRGWLALAWATILSGPSHANKLLAGYVSLRALGIEAHFVDVLLVQTLITFLLYFFAPTPGGSGIGEVLSALIMAAYVPKPLTPLYTIIWRLILSWYTIAFGFVVFSTWVRQGVRGIGDDDGAPDDGERPAAAVGAA